MNWTNPYHGVSHINGLPRGWRITVSEMQEGGFAQCCVADPAHPFSGAVTNHDTVAEAITHGEGQARALGLQAAAA